MRRVPTSIIILVSLLFMACGVHTQQGAIADARMGLAITGEAVKMADEAAKTHFEQFPPEDTENYCKGEIVTLALEEVVAALEAAADSVKLWETSLAIYMAKKEAGEDGNTDWSTVLSSEADWFKVAVDVVAVLDVVMRELEHAGVKIPSAVSYAWKFIYGLTGKEPREPYEMTWGGLEDGVCAEYLPGGGS